METIRRIDRHEQTLVSPTGQGHVTKRRWGTGRIRLKRAAGDRQWLQSPDEVALPCRNEPGDLHPVPRSPDPGSLPDADEWCEWSVRVVV